MAIVPQPAATFADWATPLVEMVIELRPDLAVPVAASLVVEALDEHADNILDLEWAKQRRAMYPAALRLAHSRHQKPYAERRRLELVDALPRGADYPGGPVPWDRGT